MRMKSPTVTITTAITERCCTGRMTTSWITTPSTNEIASVGEERSPVRQAPEDELVRDERRCHRHLALREVDHLGRAIDEHECEREAREDRALREACDGLLREDRAHERADDEEDGDPEHEQHDRNGGAGGHGGLAAPRDEAELACERRHQ